MASEIENLSDSQKCSLVDNRWTSSDEIWSVVKKVYKENTGIYENGDGWMKNLPVKSDRIQANRIFVNMESVINSLIANPPQLNMLAASLKVTEGEGEETKEEEVKKFALSMENYFSKRYKDLNVKEVIRMGLRNLYFGRLIVVKPFWNRAINDFDVKVIDPRKIRFGKYAKNEEESEFAIEEVDDNLVAVIARFPDKKDELMEDFGIESEEELYIRNPDITYKEAWISDYVIFKYKNIILGTMKNPYWDWDGLLITEEEEQKMQGLIGEDKRFMMQEIRQEQASRKGSFNVGQDLNTEISYNEYFFNYFDTPRKPYIFATIFNNKDKPIGRTDMIQLSKTLQRSIDKRKMDIGENASLANGQVKVDSSVMTKNDAQKLRFEARGVIYGKGVKDGVTRETGESLPQIVFDDMQDSRNEIDNIMAASSAFKGDREGQETKGGRLALIEQSFLRLNELVQVIDYVHENLFAWFYQLAKLNYTEPHYAKWMGQEQATENIEIQQDDFQDGSEIRVISGKSLPEDKVFRFQLAQADVAGGLISPTDYLRIANYDNPREMSRNAVLFAQNPSEAVGITEDELPLPAQPGELSPEQSGRMIQAEAGIDEELGPLPEELETPQLIG